MLARESSTNSRCIITHTNNFHRWQMAGRLFAIDSNRISPRNETFKGNNYPFDRPGHFRFFSKHLYAFVTHERRRRRTFIRNFQFATDIVIRLSRISKVSASSDERMLFSKRRRSRMKNNMDGGLCDDQLCVWIMEKRKWR